MSSPVRLRRALAVAISAAALTRCGPPPEPQPAPLASASAITPASKATGAAPPVSSSGLDKTSGDRAPVVLITDPTVLAALEARGLDLGRLIDGVNGETTHDLATRPGYGALAAAIDAELNDLRSRDSHAGVGVGDKPHRLFDARMLRAKEARFVLIGVANRIDRRAVGKRGCGEVRFIYRLAYSMKVQDLEIASKLPATLIVSFWQEPPAGDAGADGCRSVARRWLAPTAMPSPAPKGEATPGLVGWLTATGGPLSAEHVERDRLRSVALNVQTMRWPSTIRPDMAGHAEYLLRSFEPGAAGTLVPARLENTPDLDRIQRDRKLRADLLGWIRDPENLARIDGGLAVLPERFLATRSVSVSPRGLARRQNRPFRALFKPGDLAGLTLDSMPHARSPAAVLRRLDELTCAGCHQSRSVAGFHLLGDDAASPSRANALAIAVSPHLAADLPRRRRFVAALAEGKSADDAAPISERTEEAGGYGAHCGLGDPGFVGWTCQNGLRCTEDDSATDDRDVGVCLPEGPGGPGDPCEIGQVTPDQDGRRDRLGAVSRRACAAGSVCEKNTVGFPGGMCSSGCGSLPSGAACGAIPILGGFNDCLARKIPFEACIAANTRPAGVRACSEAAPCRDDYVCARAGQGGGGSPPRGVCMPPYFLFQLRVDGHPSPGAALSPARTR